MKTKNNDDDGKVEKQRFMHASLKAERCPRLGEDHHRTITASRMYIRPDFLVRCFRPSLGLRNARRWEKPQLHAQASREHRKQAGEPRRHGHL